jgi:hypothetical protein
VDAPLPGSDVASSDDGAAPADGGVPVLLDSGSLDTEAMDAAAIDTVVVITDTGVDTSYDTFLALDVGGIDVSDDMADAGRCVAQMVSAGYTSGSLACSTCSENGDSLEAKCKSMIDCVATNWPCTGNCHSNCLNTAQGDGVVDTCVTDLVRTACGATSF